MPTYKDIFNLNLKYIDYLLAKTSLTQGYIHNIGITGSEIEQEVRRLLRNLLPQRFHVTHGYIISAPSQEEEPAVSPEVDVIIVDTLVPHSIFIVDQQSGMEVVPVEAVVGVFEVKRTLNKDSLLNKEHGAIKHILTVCDTVGIRKDNGRMYLPGGVEITSFIYKRPQEYFYPGDAQIATLMHNLPQGYYSNPIIGIIGIDHEDDLDEKIKKWAEVKQINVGMIDLLFSINGYLMCLGEKLPDLPDDKIAASIQTYRKIKEGYQRQLFATFKYPLEPRSKIVAHALGFIVGYVSATGGRIFDVNKYFFNNSLLGPS